MSLPCVNSGGSGSLVRLDQVPVLETETLLSGHALAALACWQARPGEVLTVVDPESACYRARITRLEPDKAACIPFQRLPGPAESPLHITVYQALPDRERFELVLEKLTELGVSRLVPVQSQHSATLEQRDARQRKSHRWPDLIRKACRQCRRAMIPELLAVHNFAEALISAEPVELKLMLYEGDVLWTLQEGIGKFRPHSVALLVGPEGGFAPAEVEQAQAVGFMPVSLGPRILRTETAAMTAAALLQAFSGDLG